MKGVSVCLIRRLEYGSYWCIIKKFNHVVHQFPVKYLECATVLLEQIPTLLTKFAKEQCWQGDIQ